MFGKARSSDAASSARRIKDWARDVFALDESTTVMVSELTCTEPGCPPIETVIAVLRGPGDTRSYKVHRPAAEVTHEDVARLAAPASSGETGTP